ncbi:hypothetical protein TBLA_0H00790 [Henningerozyma blattae CBS 6284]|uniref:DASH complex subunit SPC19 n=1 Tax=Henningerozyma blattae (strain ATCC 34711 / CBS 6284 / DSM 70876 / NBRC 10599 / NRRL Y-10934 / UCD 77-7) TaxID=1071380 RepID=I2H7L6_HENB6|nr:hypothetical protein TBLA_0H00790 [Tetrapisispora blattae CBS 6284]CCH62368.1 hypothetical protein TBLA_0H00790 [Tetrapisispora blattae CBS 6284]
MSRSLTTCVSLLKSIVNNASSTNEILRSDPNNSADYLKTHRVFELITEYDVEQARIGQIQQQSELLQKLYTKIGGKLNLLSGELPKLQQQRALLQARLERNNSSIRDEESLENAEELVTMSNATEEEVSKLQSLKAKRLELQKQLDSINQQDT